ncbi:hypothetical protein N7507_002978 [Penicillium longicatenatum]|nr:hypothetical protein N7507_002978 [Penicillium longicatenatum]
MAFEGLLERARRRIPKPHGLIPRARRQQAAVGREGHRVNLIRMALEGLLERAYCRVLEPHGLILRARRQ